MRCLSKSSRCHNHISTYRYAQYYVPRYHIRAEVQSIRPAGKYPHRYVKPKTGNVTVVACMPDRANRTERLCDVADLGLPSVAGLQLIGANKTLGPGSLALWHSEWKPQCCGMWLTAYWFSPRRARTWARACARIWS